MKNAAVLWTGGKDSALALYEAEHLGYNIQSLVTFVPEVSEFLAHPLVLMKYQADALNLPHYPVIIHEPFRESYEEAIAALKEKDGIETLVTGDIADVDGYPNWIRQCSERSGMEVLTPLWHRDRLSLLERLLAVHYKVVFSCVKKPWLTDEWLGRELDQDAIVKLSELHHVNGLDICGEQGEYHTLVLDGPSFTKRIQIDAFDHSVKDDQITMVLHKTVLEEK
ncbi:MAG TPA: diphthine--ammonia ligase [Bacillota bacterium]|nr:diphthine--ammonia ligase [Bacillota bacterium]